MNDPGDRSVLTLHNQGKFICYYSEPDPFAGKWLGVSFKKAAEHAIDEIKLLCLVFHHVIIPPGYAIKNPAMWVVLNRLKPLFEHGLLSISIDRQFIRHPFLYFSQKLEEEVFHDITGINLAPEKRRDLTRKMKTLVKNGYFLFRDSKVQITGFGSEVENLSKSLTGESGNRPQALLEGIKRLKDEGLMSSRDHWMALLYHPSYHPPPDVVIKLSEFIHQSYFHQGWKGNHCIMYPSAFLTATYSPLTSSFPVQWFAFHVSVIAEVIAGQGVDPSAITNLPLDSFIHDLAGTVEMDFWRQAYHEQVQKLPAGLFGNSTTRMETNLPRPEPLSFAHIDPGKRIADCLAGNLNDMGTFLRQSVSRLLLNAENQASFSPNKKIMDELPSLLPGAGFLDLKVRMACGWKTRQKPINNQYIISFQQREISRPGNGKAKFDRAPFLLFLALLQKAGRILTHHDGIAIAERVSREFYGPILLQQWDPPSVIRDDSSITYPELNQIVSRLKKGLTKIGLDHAVQTVRKQGWRLDLPAQAAVFQDLPAYPPDSTNPTFLTIDIHAREIGHLDKTRRLGPLPFQLFQLLVRYHGVPINTRLINLELGLVAEPLSTSQYSAVQARVRQYIKILGKALSGIEAPVRIESEYGVGWRLSPLK